VCVSIAPLADNCTRFVAGEGVGVVTLPGLSVPPGEAAINPEPRRQILAALREVTEASVEITISIPGGAKVAEKTYNPRLGVKGGLSILGTDGRVRPFSHERRLAAVLLALDVAHAQGVTAPVLVPGHQGRRQALMQLACSAAAVVEAGNDFAPMLERCRELGMRDILILGHPGKLAKLAEGEFDTHSSRSRSALCAMERAAQSLGISLEPSAATTEAALDALDDSCRSQLCQLIAARIQASVLSRSPQITVAVRLNNLAGKVLATFGDITPWLLSSLSLPS
jgi:cobalt-precorrin-5B (C1)-methyltransferase